jgi:acyl carrier protein
VIIIVDIEEEVLKALSTLVPRGTAIGSHHKLIADLHLLSDDATAVAFELERKYRVKIPREEWQSVLTVQDVISLLGRYAT